MKMACAMPSVCTCERESAVRKDAYGRSGGDRWRVRESGTTRPLAPMPATFAVAPARAGGGAVFRTAIAAVSRRRDHHGEYKKHRARIASLEHVIP
jgi:hypothetical protein